MSSLPTLLLGMINPNAKKVQVTQTDIVHVYNQYMGGVDKLHMICMLYKPSLRTRRWYIYIWLHSILIAVVNAWFLYRRDLKICKPNVKFIQLKQFLAHLAQSLVRTVQPVSRQSLNKFQPPQSSSDSRKSNKTCSKRWLPAHANLQ